MIQRRAQRSMTNVVFVVELLLAERGTEAEQLPRGPDIMSKQSIE
jgi:hypothetical protein